jgi:predicted RND superfamily exporter protein
MKMAYLEQTIGRLVIKYRWLIILISISLVLFAASGMRYLTFSNDSRVFFSQKNPQLKALEALENTFTKDDNIIMVIAPKGGNVFTSKTLSAVENLTRESWKIPYSNRVDSITNFQHTYSSEDDLIVEDLVANAPDLSNQNLLNIKRTALSEPLLVNRLISKSGHVTAVNVNVIKPDNGKDITGIVVNHVRELVDNFRTQNPDIDLYLTGGLMMEKTFEQASQEDMTTLVPIMFAVLVVFMGLTLRSVIGTIVTLLIILFSMFTGLGLAGWIGIIMTSPSANAPVIIMTLAVADSIHLLVTAIEEMRKGQSKIDAIKESLRVNLQPVFLTSVTTAVGFLTMNFSDAPPFGDLGNIVAMGITAAFCFSIFFLPAVMAVVPLKVGKKGRHASAWFCDRLARFNVKHQRWLLPAILILTFLISAGISKIELDDNFLEYFDQRYEFRNHSDFFEENLSGMQVIEYSLDTKETNGINDPAYLATVENFASWYRSQPGVIHVNAITDIVKRLNKNMHKDDPNYYRVPQNRDLAAQYFLLYEMSLPFGLDLNNQINVEKSSSRMTVTMKNTTSKELREMDKKARKWLKGNAPDKMFTYGTGLSIIFAHISERNIKSMLWASLGALVLISVIIIFALKDIKMGLVSLLPNLMPAFVAFGLWGMTASRVGLALSVLVALTLGIVVDDTIHFMSKYLRGRKEYHMSPAQSVRYAFNTVGNALWITTLILTAGFFTLSFSGFKVNSDMGMMTSITIVIALLMDFFFLPVVLMRAEGKNNEKVNLDFNDSLVPVTIANKGGDR